MLANRLVQKITSELPDVIMNGDAEQRYAGKQAHTELRITLSCISNVDGSCCEVFLLGQ